MTQRQRLAELIEHAYREGARNALQAIASVMDGYTATVIQQNTDKALATLNDLPIELRQAAALFSLAADDATS